MLATSIIIELTEWIEYENLKYRINRINLKNIINRSS